VTDMVKNKNYNHPEIGVLREDDLVRMKVYNVFIDRKPFANQPKKNCNKKGVWLRKRKNTNYRWQKLNAKKCFDSKKRKRRGCPRTSLRENDWQKAVR
jgi:hypothetical protein